MCSSTQKLERKHFHSYVLLVTFLAAFVTASRNAPSRLGFVFLGQTKGQPEGRGHPFFFLLKSLVHFNFIFPYSINREMCSEGSSADALCCLLQAGQWLHCSLGIRRHFNPNNHFSVLFLYDYCFSWIHYPYLKQMKWRYA